MMKKKIVGFWGAWALVLVFTLFLGCASAQTRKEQIISYFFEIALGAEYGESINRIAKWKKDIRIKIRGNPTKEDIHTLNQVIKEINEIVKNIKIEVVKRRENVKLYFVPEPQFHKYNSGYVGGGLEGFVTVWSKSSRRIYKATILISTDITQKTRSSVIREELTQCLGLLQDSWRYKDSIFHHHSTMNKYSEIDKAVIELLYLDEIEPNMSKDKVKKILNRREINIPTAELTGAINMHFVVFWEIKPEEQRWTEINHAMEEVLSSYSWICPLTTFYIVKVNFQSDWDFIYGNLATLAKRYSGEVNFVMSPLMEGGRYDGWLPKGLWPKIREMTE